MMNRTQARGAERHSSFRIHHSPLSFPRAPEAAGAAAARVELLHDLETDLYHRHDDELREALHRLDGEGAAAAIPRGEEDLPLVIGVDQTDEVTEHDAVFVTEPRSRQDHGG